MSRDIDRRVDLHRILKVYVAALTGFSHVYHPDSLNTTLLSQGCVPEYGSHCMDTGRAYRTFQGQGRRGEGYPLPRSSSWVSQWSCPFTDLPQHHEGCRMVLLGWSQRAGAHPHWGILEVWALGSHLNLHKME